MLTVVSFYSTALWRIFRRAQGSKVVEYGVMTLVLAFAMSTLGKYKASQWTVSTVGILMFVMGFITVAVFIRDCYRSIRHRPSKSA